MSAILLYLGAGLTFIWGISHLFPTKNVVAGFGNISEDNRQIITMEWIVEGIFLVFIGTLVAVVTFIDPLSAASNAVYIVSSLGLLVLALVSFFTGFKVKFLPFRLCPLIFLVSAALVISGAFV
ncbi:MAG: hypothetical protein GF421_11230 [Candidatus Aminicenantes bacterium]|nr:hypothetical protein [Candidatus Aminicenantes bacterium]